MPTTLAFSTPARFFNTSLFAGCHYWDFGDGTSAKDKNQSRNYTASGSYNDSRVAYKCSSWDTSIVTVITVGAATIGTVKHDPLKLSVNSGLTGDGNSSQIQNPIYTFTNTGVYNVLFIASSASCNGTINRQVTVYGNICIEEFNAASINVYPLPTNGKVSIEWNEVHNAEHAEIYHGTGRSITKFTTEGSTHNLDVSAWANGVYMLKLHNDKGEQILKQVIIQH